MKQVFPLLKRPEPILRVPVQSILRCEGSYRGWICLADFRTADWLLSVQTPVNASTVMRRPEEGI